MEICTLGQRTMWSVGWLTIIDATMGRTPLTIEAYVAVKDKSRAIELEKYFKTGSGKAVLLKRIL